MSGGQQIDSGHGSVGTNSDGGDTAVATSGNQSNTGQGSLGHGGTAVAATGHQATGAQGEFVKSYHLPLRSKKNPTGSSATIALAGQPAGASAGSFGVSRTSPITGSLISLSTGNV